MAQPGDGSASLEKAVEEGPVAAPEQDQFLHANTTSNSTVVDDVDDNVAHKEKENDVKPTPGVQVNDDGPEDVDKLIAHLPENEKRLLKLQLDEPNVTASFGTLYRYATAWDIVIMLVAALCSIAAGAAMPLFTVSSLRFLPLYFECPS